MSSDQLQNLLDFFCKVEKEAGRYALNVLRLHDVQDCPPPGLLLLKNGLSKAANQTILANIAGYLYHGPACPAKGDCGPTAHEPGAEDYCQVTVEERAQLYSFSGKGANG